MQKRDILKWFQFLRHSEPIREKASATVLFCFGWSLWIGHKLLLESRKYRFKYKKPRDRRKLGSVLAVCFSSFTFFFCWAGSGGSGVGQ